MNFHYYRELLLIAHSLETSDTTNQKNNGNNMFIV